MGTQCILHAVSCRKGSDAEFSNEQLTRDYVLAISAALPDRLFLPLQEWGLHRFHVQWCWTWQLQKLTQTSKSRKKAKQLHGKSIQSHIRTEHPSLHFNLDHHTILLTFCVQNYQSFILRYEYSMRYQPLKSLLFSKVFSTSLSPVLPNDCSLLILTTFWKGKLTLGSLGAAPFHIEFCHCLFWPQSSSFLLISPGTLKALICFK